MVKRAERNLMSYERTGWVDDEPSRLTGRMEIRPAAEQGPIIVCLDTSGSMFGARETIAKAITLECIRGAHRQQRKCYLYAFSSYHDIKEIELSSSIASIHKLLDFLKYSFGGGTDVDRPLELSLERCQTQDWSEADILLVSDGQFYKPNESIYETISNLNKDMGLEVHGLLLSQMEEPMKGLCTHLHTFQAWDAVGVDDVSHYRY
eukprot:TRINITY_DN10362_c1_g1_i2.p1 TRINITY_DN10362_c1_g1~~TRINITY_DN10362_c1_g1_i2.p1  ORF type:complete len:206 (-),score=17.47 TRINITY_DN10362_c1_g1_i2:188-805(-)